MKGQEELIRRLALKRRRKIGSLSDEAFEELEIAVRKNPANFVDDNEERAFYLVVNALAKLEANRHDDDLLTDEQYAQERRRRLDALGASCSQALQEDEHCVDAALLSVLSRDLPPETVLHELMDLEQRVTKDLGSIPPSATGDAWSDPFMRPRLRLLDTIARTCLCTTRYAMARDRSIDLLGKAPLDALGARFTCTLAMARLEDEEGFNWIDAREGRHGNAWFHLSRAILMYKLGRMPAARRALRGYDQLCTGGAYVLLQPVFVDTYLPDRPSFQPNSFEEAVLAVHEADPIISDIPDFAGWACDQQGFLASAQDYCARNGLDWRNWDE